MLNSSSPHQPRKTVTPETAIQYLSARKFDIPKAVALYEANNQTRQREGLYGIDSNADPLRSELATGKFTVLVSLNEHKKELNFLPLAIENREAKERKNQNNNTCFNHHRRLPTTHVSTQWNFLHLGNVSVF